MQGNYTHIPDTNYVPREYSVAAILLLLFMALISLLLSLSLSSSPLCRVFILIFLRQTMSLGNKVLQLFCCYYSWRLYHYNYYYYHYHHYHLLYAGYLYLYS